MFVWLLLLLLLQRGRLDVDGDDGDDGVVAGLLDDDVMEDACAGKEEKVVGRLPLEQRAMVDFFKSMFGGSNGSSCEDAKLEEVDSMLETLVRVRVMVTGGGMPARCLGTNLTGPAGFAWREASNQVVEMPTLRKAAILWLCPSSLVRHVLDWGLNHQAI